MTISPVQVQNAYENAGRRYVCYLAGYLLGIAAANVTGGLGILVVPGAILAGDAICQGLFPPDGIPGNWGVPALGGQCDTFYRVTVRSRITNTGTCAVVYDGVDTAVARGPIRWQYRTQNSSLTSCGGTQRVVEDEILRLIDKFGGAVQDFGGGWPALGDFTYPVAIERLDGQADICGNSFPSVNPPLDPDDYPVAPLDPDGNPTIPEYETDEPIIDPDTQKPIYWPIIFPPIILKPDISFPITIPINLNGVINGYLTLNFDGTWTVTLGGENADKYNLDEIKKTLEEIKKCACEDDPGGTPEPIPQLNESLLGAGTGTSPPSEQFVSGITLDAVSLYVRITGDGVAPAVNSRYSVAGQKRYGSVSFTTDDVSGGGDFIYLFDRETYVPLPVNRGKPGRLRILVETGVSWNVYDSGERVRLIGRP